LGDRDTRFESVFSASMPTGGHDSSKNGCSVAVLAGSKFA